MRGEKEGYHPPTGRKERSREVRERDGGRKEIIVGKIEMCVKSQTERENPAGFWKGKVWPRAWGDGWDSKDTHKCG